MAVHNMEAQHLTFRYLGIEKGMNSLFATNCAIDQYGFIWVATSDGLARFNGKEVTYYFHETHPEIPADQIGFVYCDSQNNIWACTDMGMVKIDITRQAHRQLIIPDQPEVQISMCIESGDGVIYAASPEGMYSLEKNDKMWMSCMWFDSIIGNHRIREMRRFDKDRILICMPNSGVILVNTTSKKEEARFNVKFISCVAKFDEHSILIGASDSYKLYYATINKPDSIKEIAGPSFFHLHNPHEAINYMMRAADGKVYMTTSYEGLLSLDSTLTIYKHYVHDAANPNSIINNSMKYVLADSVGNLVITSFSGLNYTNTINASVEYINYFKTDRNEMLDESVISVAEDGNGKLWICSIDKVLRYDPNKGTVAEITVPSTTHLNGEGISPIFVEHAVENKMWVSFRYDGIAVFNADGTFEKLFNHAMCPATKIEINRPRVIREGNDGFMYIGTEHGLFRINKKQSSIDTFPDDPLIRALDRERIVDILVNPAGLWISSSPDGAVWHYDFIEKKLDRYDDSKGLNTDRPYRITSDKAGNIFVGSYHGFSIIHPDRTITNIQKGKGLISTRVESLECADDGSVWITNNYNLLKYDPVSKSIFKIGGRQGLMNLSYSVMSSAKLTSGNLVFGSNKGIIIVDPSKLHMDSKLLHVYLFYHDADGTEREWMYGIKRYFNYKQNHLRFSFAVNDMMIADQVMYRYKMSSGSGDDNWTSADLNSNVDFNLNAGTFRFQVQAFDGHDWYGLPGDVIFSINAPWWKQWWFILGLAMSLLGVFLYYLYGKIEKFRKEIIVARQITDLESKALRAQMNPHFVFNSLNAIQECIVTGRIEEAYTYLSTFSKLLRMVLENSDVPEVSLQDELEVFSLYISLEKLRFKDDMIYDLELNPDIDTEEILVPPMLIQPHLENSIWHGLRHKTGNKILKLSISEHPVGYLEVIIEDNGIGRAKSEEIRKTRLGGNQHRSRGKQLSENRMTLLSQIYPLTNMAISDLHDAQGDAVGTKVILTIPIIDQRTGNSN